MDPEANLAEMLELAQSIVDFTYDDEDDGDSTAPAANDAERLAELVLALDGWIKGGGFLPKSWAATQRR